MTGRSVDDVHWVLCSCKTIIARGDGRWATCTDRGSLISSLPRQQPATRQGSSACPASRPPPRRVVGATGSTGSLRSATIGV